MASYVCILLSLCHEKLDRKKGGDRGRGCSLCGIKEEAQIRKGGLEPSSVPPPLPAFFCQVGRWRPQTEAGRGQRRTRNKVSSVSAAEEEARGGGGRGFSFSRLHSVTCRPGLLSVCPPRSQRTASSDNIMRVTHCHPPPPPPPLTASIGRKQLELPASHCCGGCLMLLPVQYKNVQSFYSKRRTKGGAVQTRKRERTRKTIHCTSACS